MIDWTVILTGIGTVIAVVGSNVALIAWLRSDMKSFEIEIRSDMKSFRDEVRKDILSYRDEVRNEMKDFHGRLCTIEERSKK